MSILLENLVKRYDGQPVVNHVSLEVKDGEFFVLLGSSGSGKTTILNLIAGLTPLDSGRIVLNGRDVTGLPTQQRRVGFVFQNYALFQYMNVAENIEFALSIRKVPKIERQNRRDELLDLVGLGGLGGRMPGQLSGGQQQRVALARALAHKPDVLLLDEPLGALDAKIRVDLRRSLRAIQQQLGIAAILVTHDQEEAFDLADRIGVMSYGRLLEVGPPEDLYRRPQTEFVATFLGSANLLVGRKAPGGFCIGEVRFPTGLPDQNRPASKNGHRVQLLFRPEEVALAASPEELDCPCLGPAEVQETGFSGACERLRLKLPPLPGVRPIAPTVAYGSESVLVEATRPPDQAESFPLARGQQAYLGIRRIHAIDHPGLNFILLYDGSMRTRYALELAGQIGRMAHARLTLLNYAGGTQEARSHDRDPDSDIKKALGTGLAAFQEIHTSEAPAMALKKLVEKGPCDLVIMGFRSQEDQLLAEEVLRVGEHHLLLVPTPQAAPTLALICVTAGEPAKDDVFFAGRLIYHLGADSTLVTVLPGQEVGPAAEKRASRFLEGGVRTLAVLGIPAATRVLRGQVADQIIKTARSGDYDLLVMGVPLNPRSGEISLTGVVAEVLKQVSDRAILLVRSQFTRT
jgi:sulfate/thiosulfate transport system ATP-binding protein